MTYERIKNGLKKRLYKLIGLKPINITVHDYPVEKIGGPDYGHWYIPTGILKEDSICYCAGVGEDISFDLDLVKRGCKVFSFDPTPRAIEYVKRFGKGITFLPVGLWSSDMKKKFYVPRNPTFVSHSISNMGHTTDYFEAECRSVKSIMKSHGHTELDLLKMDIEGAEYEVIYSVLKENIPVKIIAVELVELFSPFDADSVFRIRKLLKTLENHGYILVNYDKNEHNLTFINNKLVI
jgi:FkbM family methyltransferase